MKKSILILNLCWVIFMLFACQSEDEPDNDFQATINASFLGGLEATLSGSDASERLWSSELTGLDFKAYMTDHYQATGLMNLMTTSDGIILRNAVGDIKTTDYITIPIHIRTQDKTPIHLSSIALNGLDKFHRLEVGFHDPKGQFISARDSFRINIIAGLRVSVQGQVEDASHIIIYEHPETDTNVVLGGHVDANFRSQPIGAHDYHFCKVGNHLPGSDQVNVPETVTEINHTVIWTFSENDLPNSAGYYEITIYVRIWIELWDTNSFTEIIHDYFTTTFEFIQDDPTPEETLEDNA